MNKSWKNQQCGNCTFWVEQPLPPGQIPAMHQPKVGFCRRFPPALFAVVTENPITHQPNININPHYPPLTANYPACAEFISIITRKNDSNHTLSELFNKGQ